MKGDLILNELISKQLINIPHDKKLNYNDLKRICKYISSSIFDEHYCCLWKGYVTNINNDNKGTYINFYFRKKKMALHRLLYINFIGDLSNDEYIKFNCDNKGQCCNVMHFKKYKYNKNNKSKSYISTNKVLKQSKAIKIITRETDYNDNLFKLTFN
jgi:hypothetical protein